MAAKTAFALPEAMVKRDSALAVLRPSVIFLRMKRLAAFFAFSFTLSSLPAASPLLTLDNVQLPSPAGVGAQAPQFIASGSRQVTLSWIQPGLDNAPALHFAQLDPQTHAWGKATVVGPATASPATAQVNTAPVTASNAGRLATVWFVDDKKDPRVLLSVSPDAGAHFLLPQRIEDARPIGSPDLVLLGDGTVFASWLEHYNKDETAIWLRRISPGGELSVPVLLASLPAARPFPRIVLVKDYDDASAQLLLAYTLGEGETAQIITRLLTISRPALSSSDKPCNCPTDDETARGYALRGRVVSLSPERGIIVVKHEEIPGMLLAATTEFKTDPATLKSAVTGSEVFARIERRGTEWWLFSARLIVRP